ncbi:hypothetical protein [Nocardia colli]|uniref:hypothetical protein n=1 Tax=Nocardia colli TaxID=2545717 RepID=UPI0035D6ED38
MDLNKMVTASASWQETATDLEAAARGTRSIAESHGDINWSIFDEAWQAQKKAAEWLRDRLREGSSEATSISNVLTHVATVLQEKDENFAKVLIKLQEGL